MEEENSELHSLIDKQLKRSHLCDNDIAPTKQKEWKNFLSRISRIYKDQEQERYLLERSLDISSHEMMDLNEKLEFAQKIAHLGYWVYDRIDDKLIWSKEMFNLTGIDPSEGTPTLQNAFKLVHKEDQLKLQSLINMAFNEDKDFETELRVKNKKDDKYYWHYTKAHPHGELNEDKAQSSSTRYLSGVAIDITERKLAEENLEKMHLSRQAGMAEVATSILHNIGNILNSANVSISILIEIMEKARIDKLIQISKLIKEHLQKKDAYLIHDEKGKFVPDYLIALAHDISEDARRIMTEIENIENHLSHINDVVSLQKDISGISIIKESIYLNDMIDLAIQMSLSKNDINEIEINKHYEYTGSIVSEKAKLLQILINLLKNACDSIKACKVMAKRIDITVKKSPHKPYLNLIVNDNGLGIAQENLNRIFSFGFTTKPDGHGFGLHSSSIAASELGGKLNATSDGIGKGASFIIELPLIYEKNTQIYEETIKNE